MSWRPDGWRNPYKEQKCLPCELVNADGRCGTCIPQECEGSAFEDGADAMLRELRKMGLDPESSLGFKHLFKNHKVVFIPDD